MKKYLRLLKLFKNVKLHKINCLIYKYLLTTDGNLFKIYEIPQIHKLRIRLEY